MTTFVSHIMYTSALAQGGLLALTPWERWSAAARMGANNNGSQWVILIAVTVLIVLLALLLKASFNRRQMNRQLADQQFMENVRRRNLSVREYHMLLDVVSQSRLRDKGAIFENAKAFELGVSRIVTETIDKQDTEQSERFLAELEFLREKLGFKRREGLGKTPISKKAGNQKLTTRNIPLGKTLRITRRLGRDASEFTTTVVANDEQHLTATLELPMKVTFAEMWRVHCFFGASAWEFDTSVVSCEGDKLVLKHSDDVRFVNRRRFVRTQVSCPAYICSFPFMQVQPGEAYDSAGKAGQPLSLVEGHVTELAGSGLQIRSQLEVGLGDRVLVIFQLVDQRDPQIKEGMERVTRHVQDIGVVRRIDTLQGGFVLGIELMGLTDIDIDELLRVAKLVSFSEKAEAVLEDVLAENT